MTIILAFVINVVVLFFVASKHSFLSIVLTVLSLLYLIFPFFFFESYGGYFADIKKSDLDLLIAPTIFWVVIISLHAIFLADKASQLIKRDFVVYEIGNRPIIIFSLLFAICSLYAVFVFTKIDYAESRNYKFEELMIIDSIFKIGLIKSFVFVLSVFFLYSRGFGFVLLIWTPILLVDFYTSSRGSIFLSMLLYFYYKFQVRSRSFDLKTVLYVLAMVFVLAIVNVYRSGENITSDSLLMVFHEFIFTAETPYFVVPAALGVVENTACQIITSVIPKSLGDFSCIFSIDSIASSHNLGIGIATNLNSDYIFNFSLIFFIFVISVFLIYLPKYSKIALILLFAVILKHVQGYFRAGYIENIGSTFLLFIYCYLIVKNIFAVSKIKN